MASRGQPVPYFPIPPDQYDQRYLTEVVRSFSVFLNQVNNPGPSRATNLTLTNLQTDDYGLENGALFQQDGFVKITLANKPHLRGVPATGAVGSVTVTIS